MNGDEYHYGIALMIPLVLLMWLAQTGDLLTTFLALGRGCEELNPVMASLSWPGMVSLKTGAVLLVTVLIWRHHKVSPHTAKALLWWGIGAGAGLAVWNLFQLPYC